MSNQWIELPKQEAKPLHNVRKFKSLADFDKSMQMRKENARNNRNLSSGAKLIYLSGKARMCNAEKVLKRGNQMRGFKV